MQLLTQKGTSVIIVEQLCDTVYVEYVTKAITELIKGDTFLILQITVIYLH